MLIRAWAVLLTLTSLVDSCTASLFDVADLYAPNSVYSVFSFLASPTVAVIAGVVAGRCYYRASNGES